VRIQHAWAPDLQLILTMSLPAQDAVEQGISEAVEKA
jgi:hypothetical protein